MTRKRRGLCLRIVLGIATAAALGAHAQERPHTSAGEDRGKDTQSSARISFAEILKQAADNNPEIKAALHKYKAATARPSQERTLPDPMIGFMATNMGSAVPFESIGEDPMSNAGVSFSQEIPFPGKRALKGDMATAEAKSAFEEYRATTLEVLSRVKAAYYEYAYLHHAESVLTRNLSDLAKLAKVADTRYQAGSGNQQDVLKAELETSVARARLISIEQRRGAALARLNALRDQPADSAVGEPEPLKKIALKASFEELAEAAKTKSPMLNARQALVERDKTGVDYARRQYYPDFAVGGYYGNSGDLPDMWQWRIDLKVPLYYRSKQRFAVKESVHTLTRSQHEREAALQAITAALKEEYLRARAAEKLVDLYSRTIVRDARLAFDSSLQSYQTGQIDFLNVLTNLVMARDYEIGGAEELMNFLTAVAAMEALTGVALE